MGTWISHLRIAENLLGCIPGLEEVAFGYGSLAPDSGVPSENWSRFDPPKTVTHFLAEGDDEGQIRDLDFYRQHILPLSNGVDPADYAFRLGYFFHLVCDNLWAFRFRERYREDYAAQFAEVGGKFIWTIKKDWYDLDHKYLRDRPDSFFWRSLLPAANPPAYLPFLPEQALHHQLDHIKNFYANERPPVLDRPYPYLSEATMDRFIADSTASLLNIHARLAHQAPGPEVKTALTWLSPAEFAVYPGPVGDPQPG